MRALAWVVCVVGLALCLVCGQQAAWINDRGGYQRDGYNTLVDGELDQFLWTYTGTVAQEFSSAQANGADPNYVKHIIDDENFSFAIRNDRGAVLLSNGQRDDYQASFEESISYYPPGETETFYRTYATPEERDQALDELMNAYDYVDFSFEDHIYGEESSSGYVLSAECTKDGELVEATVTGYIPTVLVSSGDIYWNLSYVQLIAYYRYEILMAAGIAGVLGLLALALLVRGAGRRDESGTVVLSWLDRKVPTEVLVPVMVVMLILWLLLGVNVVEIGLQTLHPIPLSSLIFSGIVMALLAATVVSLVRRKQAGLLHWNLKLSYQQVLRFGRWVQRGWRRLLEFFLRFWAAGISFVLLCVVELLCFYYYSTTLDGIPVLIWLLLKFLEGGIVIHVILSMKTLSAGGKELAAGNLDYKVATDRLYGEFRKHGENLNNLRQGIQHAVEEQMKSERMKTELITNVSHDIKTPLTSIVSYVDLLKKEPMPNDQAREYLNVLDRQAARLKKLTEDLVEASKASTGNLTVHFQPTDVNVLLSQSSGEYQERLAARDLSLVLTPAEEAPWISADGQLLWRVFENLLSNAQKYAMPGTRVYLSCQATEAEVAVTFRNVSATPLNISAEELMDRFVRGDAARSTEGSGLGLSIARDLTQLQHGRFDLTIDGDLFKVVLTFPRCPQPPEDAGK